MMNNADHFSITIERILESIDYRGDRYAFIERCRAACLHQALASLLTALPPDQQVAFEQHASTVRSLEETSRLLQDVVGMASYPAAVEQATQQIIQKLLSDVMPALTPSQQDSLLAHLSDQPS